jgi:chemotaxis protein methyltransferase CheR
VEVNDACGRILAGLLETRTGQQLASNRRWRIETALNSLMRDRGLDNLDQLISSIISSREPSLTDAVVEALLNHETSFYRDRAPFELLLKGALTGLERARQHSKRISIWCAGCSTGQEAYSLAMSFAEDKRRWQGWTIDILATDVSASAIAQARAGTYSQFEVQRGLAVLQMMRWFEEQGGKQWRISPDLRRAVRFRQHNLLEAPPALGRFDIILCRNVLLYFSPETGRAVFERLAEAAAPDAVLMLGAGETVIGQSDAFAPDPIHRGLYMRTRRSEPIAARA